MNRDLFLAVDAGTQAAKAGLFNTRGDMIEISQKEYRAQTRYIGDYGATQNANHWWEAVKSVILDITSKYGSKILSVGVDATAPSLVLVDKKGYPLGDAMMWDDRRSIRQAQIIQDNADEELLRYCGGTILPEWSLPKILWMKENDPRYREAHMVLDQADFIIHKLTGGYATSRLTLIRKANYSPFTEGWSPHFLEDIGLEDLLDKIPNEIEHPWRGGVLSLTRDVAEELKLEKFTNVKLCGLDSYVGLVGMGVVNDGQVGIIMGSSVPFKVLTDKPIFSENLLGPFYDVVIPNTYILSGAIPAGGTLIRWVTENSGYSPNNLQKGYEALEAKAENIQPGSNNLLCLPYWDGVKTPIKDPKAKGAFVGFDFSHQTEHMFRAVYEAIAYSTRHSLEELGDLDYHVGDVILGGGGSKSRLLCQIMADVLGKEVKLAFTESSLLGNAMLNASSAGLGEWMGDVIEWMTKEPKKIEPNPGNHQIYSELFQRYTELYPALKNIMQGD